MRPQWLAEADREPQYLHATAARDPVMAEFVKRDEHADGDDEAAQRPRKIKHPLPPAPAHVPSCRSRGSRRARSPPNCAALLLPASFRSPAQSPGTKVAPPETDRKSTRLNSSH